MRIYNKFAALAMSSADALHGASGMDVCGVDFRLLADLEVPTTS